MMVINFTVPGNPKGKGRPRFARRGNFVTTYTDSETAKYEDQIRFYALRAMGSSEPLETPVCVYFYIRLPIPASYSKKRREACLSGIERPTKKPDWDNVSKVVADSMNGIVYKDDVQIVDAIVRKTYSDEPGLEIIVREVCN